MAAGRRSRSESIAPAFGHFLFDLDGTLVDSSDDLVAATNFALQSLELPALPRAAVLSSVGNGVRRLMRASLACAAPGRSAGLLETALERFREFYGAHLLDRTRPYPGVEAALSGLCERGARLSVLTNKPRGFSTAILAGLGLASFFFATVCGDDEVPRKPDPRGALELVRSSGVPARRSLLIGDSAVDLETARAAALASCAVTWGFRDPGEIAAAGPDHVVRAARELLDLCPPA